MDDSEWSPLPTFNIQSVNSGLSDYVDEFDANQTFMLVDDLLGKEPILPQIIENITTLSYGTSLEFQNEQEYPSIAVVRSIHKLKINKSHSFPQKVKEISHVVKIKNEISPNTRNITTPLICLNVTLPPMKSASMVLSDDVQLINPTTKDTIHHLTRIFRKTRKEKSKERIKSKSSVICEESKSQKTDPARETGIFEEPKRTEDTQPISTRLRKKQKSRASKLKSIVDTRSLKDDDILIDVPLPIDPNEIVSVSALFQDETVNIMVFIL